MKSKKIIAGISGGIEAYKVTNRQSEIVIEDRCRTGISGVFVYGDVTNFPFM